MRKHNIGYTIEPEKMVLNRDMIHSDKNISFPMHAHIQDKENTTSSIRSSLVRKGMNLSRLLGCGSHSLACIYEM